MRLIETHFGIDVVMPPEQLTQLYDSIFEGFDCDKSGMVDRNEFREEFERDGGPRPPQRVQREREEEDRDFQKEKRKEKKKSKNEK
jgi:hypothetical protein